MKLTLYPFELKFRHTFTISRKSKDVQPLLVVELKQDGLSGLGETADNSYYNMTVPRLMEAINAHRPFIENYTLDKPEAFWQDMFPLLSDNMFALCALDLAAWDLYAKRQHKKLYEVWGLNISHNPLTDYTIGIDTIDKMVEKMKAKPWPIYKIKLGTDEDIEIVTALRKHTNAILRIDANAGWQAEEALEKINELQHLNVELIEQPLAKDDWEGMKILFERSLLPLIADEVCVYESDVEKCRDHFHGINIKLTKCGGITPALRMIQKARSLDMKVMVGCMNESSIGSAAIVHLNPYLDYVDVDGPLLLAEDVATGLTYDYGKVNCSDAAGLGVGLSDSLIL